MSPIYPCDNSFFSESSSSNSSTCSSSTASTTSDLIDSASSSVSVKGNKCGNLFSKVTCCCCLPEKFKRNEKVEIIIPSDCELGYTGSSGDPFNAPSEISHYQMSSTRKLAFGGFEAETFSTIQDEKKARHLKEFYNNTTLSNIAKLFSACVLISALFILIRRILSWNWPY